MLIARDLSKTYQTASGPVEVLRGVSFQIAPGQTVALTGESGSGKSTLLHLCAGLEEASGGQVTIDGTALGTLGDEGRAQLRREKIGLVFQQFNLIPSLSVRANIAFQARLAGRHDAGWAADLATRLGLDPHLDKYPEQLSGGQQQRVAIARALAGRPQLILADEPTGNLDEASGDRVMALLLDLVASTGAGLLMVTHSERLAGRLAQRLHLAAGRLA